MSQTKRITVSVLVEMLQHLPEDGTVRVYPDRDNVIIIEKEIDGRPMYCAISLDTLVIGSPSEMQRKGGAK